MNKKKWMQHLPVIVAFLCAASVIAMLSYKFIESRNKITMLYTAISGQRTALANLSNINHELLYKRPEPAPCPSVGNATTAAQTDVQAVLDPAPEISSDMQTKIDVLKKRYEDILVTYFVLRQCEKIAPTDYHIIISALSQEMASVSAPGRLQYDILTSAQGSYKELYSGNQCDPATTDPLQTQYQAFVDGISAEFLPR